MSTMPQWLGVLRLAERFHPESAWDDAARAAVQSHFERLKADAAAGRVILAGRTLEPNPETRGLVIFEAADRAAAETYLREDPAVAAGVMLAEVHPYRVAVYSSPSK